MNTREVYGRVYAIQQTLEGVQDGADQREAIRLAYRQATGLLEQLHAEIAAEHKHQ